MMNKPKYKINDRALIVVWGDREKVLQAVITGVRYCNDVSEWMYCFELGQTPRSGIIWFYEWELDNFQTNYELEPIKSSYPTTEENDENVESIDEISF